MCRDIQPAGLFCFLQFSADLWAAVVGKCQVINNSYTSVEAAEREMPLGNGMSDKSRFHNSAISHNTISLFWVYGKLVILHKCGRSLPLLGHMTQRYTWFKNEALLLLSRVGQVDHRKERNNGLYLYICIKKGHCISKSPRTITVLWHAIAVYNPKVPGSLVPTSQNVH